MDEETDHNNEKSFVSYLLWKLFSVVAYAQKYGLIDLEREARLDHLGYVNPQVVQTHEEKMEINK